MSNSKITLTFLGVGSAFAKKNYQNNLLIENESENILIDCGSTAPRSLYEMKRSILDIDNIFVTHIHGDHVQGLEETAFMSFFVGRPTKRKKVKELMEKEGIEEIFPGEYHGKDVNGAITLSGENWKLLNGRKDDFKPTIISTINILNNLWDNCLKGGLNSVQYQLTQMNDYFNVETLVHNDKRHAVFNKCGLRFELIRVDHVYIEKKFDVPSYGLVIEEPESGKQILYTGDTKFDWDTFQWVFKSVDVIFHDCQLFDQDLSVHATYNELCKLPSEVKAKMWLMHYGDNFDKFDPKKDGFKGFVKQQTPMLLDEI